VAIEIYSVALVGKLETIPFCFKLDPEGLRDHGNSSDEKYFKVVFLYYVYYTLNAFYLSSI